MQLPLDFGKPGTLRAVPLTASVTFPAFKATATLSVRRPGWRARAIRYAQPSLSLATVIKLATLQLLIENTHKGWTAGSHWIKVVYGFLKGLM